MGFRVMENIKQNVAFILTSEQRQGAESLRKSTLSEENITKGKLW